MKFTSFTTIAATLVVLLLAPFAPSVTATPVSLSSPVESMEKRDVFVPPITSPTAGVVWKVGQHKTVTWDTSDRPVNITNSRGRIMLRKGDLTTPVILANNFDILLGKIGVKVPWVEDGDDYQLVLFGDSGNFSPKFTIRSN